MDMRRPEELHFLATDSELRSASRLFEELGRRIERDFRAVDYQISQFPSVATEALIATAIPEHLDARDLRRWVFGIDRFPQQEDIVGLFGSPPITVFRSDAFFVSLLFWRNGTTDTHQHAFSGAFQVLDGCSVHATYDFEMTRTVNEYVQLGALTRSTLEFLNVGDAHPIPSGSQLIHALVHLEKPTVTAVVRTYRDPWSSPQLNYLRQGVRYDQVTDNVSLRRRLELIDTLGPTDPDSQGALFALVLSGDPLTTVRALLHLADRAWQLEDVEPALDELSRRDLHFASTLRDAYDQRVRDASLFSAMRRVTRPDLRFLFLLSALEPSRDEFVAVTRCRYPGEEPGDLLPQWIAEAARALVPPSYSDWAGFVAQGLLSGLGRTFVIDAAQAQEGTRTTADPEQIGELYDRLRASSVLRTLMCGALGR